VFQPFRPYRPWLEDYARMTTVIPRKINDEDHNDKVKFLNLQTVWQEHDFFPGSLVDPVHFSNDGHKLVTTYLSDWLFPFVQDRCAQLLAAKAAPAQHAN
jgi:hypothetical protein